jgi:hypothetical protein
VGLFDGASREVRRASRRKNTRVIVLSVDTSPDALLSGTKAFTIHCNTFHTKNTGFLLGQHASQ